MTEEMIVGKDGLKLFTRSWRAGGPVRAAVVLVHGFKAHSGTFDWAARQLVERGLAVYAVDLRGHGKSEGEPLMIEAFNDYLADVDTVVDMAQSRHPGLPLFLLGHSAGGVISCSYALENQEHLAGFICESFAQEIPAPDIVLAVVKGLSHIAPHAGVLDLKSEDFSRDPSVVAALKNDPLISPAKYPSQTIAEMARADERLRKAFPSFMMPVLILHGTADKVTVPHGSQFFFETAGSRDKTLKLYEGHVHDLLTDIGKEKVLADIAAWIDDRIGA